MSHKICCAGWGIGSCYLQQQTGGNNQQVVKADLSITAISRLIWITKVPMSKEVCIIRNQTWRCMQLSSCTWIGIESSVSVCRFLCFSSTSLTTLSIMFCLGFFGLFLTELVLIISRDEDCAASCCLVTGEKSKGHSIKSEIKLKPNSFPPSKFWTKCSELWNKYMFWTVTFDKGGIKTSFLMETTKTQLNGGWATAVNLY